MSSDGADAVAEWGLGEEWLVRRPGARERRWFLLHGLVRGLFWLLPFLVVALLWVFWFEVPFRDRVPLGITALGLLVLALLVAWGLIYPKNWRVSIGPTDVMVEHGIIRLTRVLVSYDRVQQIDRVSTPVLANLDLTELVLHSAAGGVRIYALDPADAELIADRVRQQQLSTPGTL
jgi:membrane protein YdbS with pleckstrin-like domain